MTATELKRLVSRLPGVTDEILWGDNLVFKVGGRMFLVSGTTRGSGYSFKVAERDFLALTEVPGIRPAPYLARASWVAVTPRECQLGKPLLKKLIKQSYDIVFAKLSKKRQRELGG